MVSYLGTPYYVAPEIIENKGYDEQCDIWSLGVCLFRLLTGEYPYKEEQTHKLLKAIQTKEVDVESFDFSLEAKNLIKGLLFKDPLQRLKISEVIVHPFFSKVHK